MLQAQQQQLQQQLHNTRGGRPAVHMSHHIHDTYMHEEEYDDDFEEDVDHVYDLNQHLPPSNFSNKSNSRYDSKVGETKTDTRMNRK
jgi:hypothetical protein